MFIFAAKISHDLFFVIDQIFLIFPFFSQSFPMFAMLNVIIDPFLTGKTPFFTLFILSRASDNTTSQNIGGTNAWAVPHLKFLGGPSPQSHLGLRPWLREPGSRRMVSDAGGVEERKERSFIAEYVVVGSWSDHCAAALWIFWLEQQPWGHFYTAKRGNTRPENGEWMRSKSTEPITVWKTRLFRRSRL